jgi:hypothetical protein
MLGRHSHWAMPLSPNMYFFSFLWLYWGLNWGLYACKAAFYCLSHIISPFWCGSVKGTACAPVSIDTFIPSFPGATNIWAHCKWLSFLTWVAWARTYCFSNEERVWTNRSIISFYVNWKVWMTEIKAPMYLSGHQYSCPDVFKFPLDLIAGRGHRLAHFLPLPVEGGNTH